MCRTAKSAIVAVAISSLTIGSLGGCESQGHSQGLLDQKRSGSVKNPYIVRDPGSPSGGRPPETQPAAPAERPE